MLIISEDKRSGKTMSYVSLEKLLHLDSSSARFSANESMARLRL